MDPIDIVNMLSNLNFLIFPDIFLTILLLPLFSESILCLSFRYCLLWNYIDGLLLLRALRGHFKLRRLTFECRQRICSFKLEMSREPYISAFGAARSYRLGDRSLRQFKLPLCCTQGKQICGSIW